MCVSQGMDNSDGLDALSNHMNISTETTDPKMEYKTYITCVFLSVFSLVGVVGNSLVLYGFTRNRQKFTSSLFILTLAGIDLITCLVTIPSTIAMEVLSYNVSYDVICKIYHFLITTTIPLSASLMVAIAVDRYFCICRPFVQIMTRYRVGVIVVCLCLFAISLGMFSCLNYGIYKHPYEYADNIFSHNISLLPHGPEINSKNSQLTLDLQMLDVLSRLNVSGISDIPPTTGLINTHCCQKNFMLFGVEFDTVYQNVYFSFYALCGVLVIVLYSYIYHFILRRRQRRLRMESFPCCTFKVPQNHADSENTEVMYLSQDASMIADEQKDKDKNHNAESQKHLVRGDGDERTRDKFSLGHEKQERIRRNNIKTAIMLSLVAAVFILAFLPAWLMKLHVVPMNFVVFNMYFIYNVVNPFIYAFMNPEFQQQLKEIFVNVCR